MSRQSQEGLPQLEQTERAANRRAHEDFFNRFASCLSEIGFTASLVCFLPTTDHTTKHREITRHAFRSGALSGISSQKQRSPPEKTEVVDTWLELLCQSLVSQLEGLPLVREQLGPKVLELVDPSIVSQQV